MSRRSKRGLRGDKVKVLHVTLDHVFVDRSALLVCSDIAKDLKQIKEQFDYDYVELQLVRAKPKISGELGGLNKPDKYYTPLFCACVRALLRACVRDVSERACVRDVA